MKKKVVAWVLVSAMAAGCLAGCGGNSSEGTSGASGGTQAKSESEAQSSSKSAAASSGGTAESGEAPKVVVIPKVMGIAYFDDSYVGLEAGAKDFGVDLVWDGPTEASATEQAKIAEDYLAQDVDAILICPNDATALETTMQKVKDAGVIAMNWDSNFNNQLVDYDIISVDTVSYGEMIFEELAKSMDGKGDYAILTSTLDVADHNQWIEAGTKYLEEKYPDMNLISDPVATGEDQQVAYTKTLELMNTYPELSGIVGISSVNAPGAAQAVREQGKQDSIQVVGTSLPSQVGDYLEDGAVDASVLWRPAYVTYVTMYVVSEVYKGNKIEDGTKLTMFDGTEYTLSVKDGNIITPTDPMVFTVDNYADYSF
ncbi:substrate-binding domain-containing protein [Lachnospiraceae bacterium LCP19S3_B12]